MIKCTSLFSYQSQNGRHAGWSETWYIDANFTLAREAMSGVQNSRAGMMPSTVEITGQRYTQLFDLQGTSGKSLATSDRFPGGARGLIQDVPQMALLCSAQAVGTNNVKRYTLRGMPDTVMVGGDFNSNDLIDRNLALAGLTRQQVKDMAAACIAKASGYGWTRGQNLFVYNNNAYNDTVVAGLQDAGIIAGRGGPSDGRFVFAEGGVVNPMRIPAATWDQLTTAQITPQIDRIIETGATGWVYWHNVFSTARVADDGQAAVGSATPSAYAASNSTYCTPRGITNLTIWWEELKGALDYIKAKEVAGLIDVMSPSEWALRNGLGVTL